MPYLFGFDDFDGLCTVCNNLQIPLATPGRVSLPLWGATVAELVDAPVFKTGYPLAGYGFEPRRWHRIVTKEHANGARVESYQGHSFAPATGA
jgi:hypothetical protein